jgi:hypothetical protein
MTNQLFKHVNHDLLSPQSFSALWNVITEHPSMTSVSKYCGTEGRIPTRLPFIDLILTHIIYKALPYEYTTSISEHLYAILKRKTLTTKIKANFYYFVFTKIATTVVFKIMHR